jgi:hypothetical protein
MRVYHAVSKVLVRQEVGIVGNNYTYSRAQATRDQYNPNDVMTPTFEFFAVRDGMESMQIYQGDFTLTPKYPLSSNYLAFTSRVVESPYLLNSMKGVAPPGSNYAFGVATRPTDRSIDSFNLYAGTLNAQSAGFTPWLTIDYLLPELETIINVRTSSYFNGVSLPDDLVGGMMLIDDEIVKVVRIISGKQIEVERGCADTVPAPHIAGAMAWCIGIYIVAFDAIARGATSTVSYKFQPNVYGPEVPISGLAATNLTHTNRAAKPYPPGRIVVNGRPWFEEAQAISGGSVSFSWARRNRVTQGSNIVSHIAADATPEANQVTRLRFYYLTPATTTGGAPVVNVLRTVDAAATSYDYTYALAQADGDTAGRALGICGTVVIYCRIMAAVGTLESAQSYVVPIRVPSYPC